MYIRLLALAIDFLVIYSGLFLSFWIRFLFTDLPSDKHPFISFIFFIFTVICVSSMALAGVYSIRFKSMFNLFKGCLFGWSLGILITMSFMYVFRERWGSLPSSLFLVSFPTIFTLLLTAKLMLYKLTGNISRKIIFIGEQELRNIDTLLGERELDEIVLTAKVPTVKQMYYLLKISEFKRAKLSILPKLYDEILSKKINERESVSFVPHAHFTNHVEESSIRASDIVIASLFLFFSLPLQVIIALIIKIDSSGPVLYKQARIGLNGREFMLYKFRSMVKYAALYSRPMEIPLENDDRVTSMGRFLRKTRLDELPQLWNILKGDMSLVGPRPEAIYRVKEHRALQGIRLSVRPGLTGLAQVEGFYYTVPRHKLRYDYLYIRNRSLSYNLNLLLRTAWVIFTRPGS